MRLREELAAICTKKIKRRVLKKQARKARAEHLVTCCLTPRKRKVQRKPLSEIVCEREFHRGQRHCEGVFADPDETRQVQEKRVEYFKEKGDWNFTEDGRGAEITMDLVLQARAKMSENKVNGLEDAVVSEMIKQLPLEKIYSIARCFQERFPGQMEATSLVSRLCVLHGSRPGVTDTKTRPVEHTQTRDESCRGVQHERSDKESLTPWCRA